MKVADILDKKGDRVVTVQPDQLIPEAARVLASSDIGAVVVAEDDGTISGILSERDIARGVDSHGVALMAKKVCDLMTEWVITCAPEQPISEVMDIMNFNNIRHLPVVEDSEVVGMLSIRDVVKNRLSELKYLDDALHRMLVSLD